MLPRVFAVAAIKASATALSLAQPAAPAAAAAPKSGNELAVQGHVTQLDLALWPYTGLEGYRPHWYEDGSRLPVLAQHKTYCRQRFFEDDVGLTVRGLPHNSVIATIAHASALPKQAINNQRAYHWPGDREAKGLIDLSRTHAAYPVKLSPDRGGVLWVVINDDDEARWDNIGLFFMTIVLTKRREPRHGERRWQTF